MKNKDNLLAGLVLGIIVLGVGSVFWLMGAWKVFATVIFLLLINGLIFLIYYQSIKERNTKKHWQSEKEFFKKESDYDD